MPFIDIAAPDVGESTKKALVDDILSNMSYIHSLLSQSISGQPINMSFEELDGNLEPVGWTITTFGNTPGSWASDTTEVLHGERSFRADINSYGGYLTLVSDDFLLPISDPDDSVSNGTSSAYKHFWRFSLRSQSNTGGQYCRVRLSIQYKDAAGSALGAAQTLMDDETREFLWETIQVAATPPDLDAKYAAFTFTFGEASNTVDGSVWLDGAVFSRLLMPGTSLTSFTTGYLTYASFYIDIPSDVTTLSVTINADPNTVGGTESLFFKGKIGAVYGSEVSRATDQSNPFDITSVFSGASFTALAGTRQLLEFQFKVSGADGATSVATLTSGYSLGTKPYETKLVMA